jgi:hypothetical protein
LATARCRSDFRQCAGWDEVAECDKVRAIEYLKMIDPLKEPLIQFMRHLTNNDKNFGPFTVGKWSHTFSAYIESGDDENPETAITFVAFGWALRIQAWNGLCRPWKERWVECNWDTETVKRLGRTGYWEVHPRRFGCSLSNVGNGYDFLQFFYGPNTNDSSTTKSWSKLLPWKQWDHVRHSLHTPDGQHFYTERKGADFREYFEKKEECPKLHFAFEDYDQELIIATCNVEEREWRKGAGWFKWLRHFSSPKIHRSLDISFSAEVGPEKGSWKGGTIGHGIDMLPNETPRQAFERYCATERTAKYGKHYSLKFIGPCDAPKPKIKTPELDCGSVGNTNG